MRSRSESTSSSLSVGAGRGMYAMGGSIGAEGDGDIRICEMFAPAAPSIMQWWTLFSSAN
jgi:hypothetical protein